MTKLTNSRLTPDGAGVVILDQTRLPGSVVYTELRSAGAMFEAIKSLRVRGAPAIGIFAAQSLAALAAGLAEKDFFEEFSRLAIWLSTARPTAVNLSWACRRMTEAAKAAAPTHEARLESLRAEALRIYEEDVEMCRRISENGLSLLKPGDGLLTHCNAGELATSRFGTGLGPILLGQERGYGFHVYTDETRPLLQGARLTAFELKNAGVDVTLICDNMAALAMKQGMINAVLIGCDRVAANGDTANKIGSLGAAVLARRYDVPFYVLGPSSTIDMTKKSGAEIDIELREPDEIRSMFYKEPMAPDVKCWNPAFDVTDNELITAIITEKGVIYPPYEEKFKELFA